MILKPGTRNVKTKNAVSTQYETNVEFPFAIQVTLNRYLADKYTMFDVYEVI